MATIQSQAITIAQSLNDLSVADAVAILDASIRLVQSQSVVAVAATGSLKLTMLEVETHAKAFDSFVAMTEAAAN